MLTRRTPARSISHGNVSPHTYGYEQFNCRSNTGKPGNPGKFDERERHAASSEAFLGAEATGQRVLLEYRAAPDDYTDDIFYEIVEPLEPNMSDEDGAARFRNDMASIQEQFDEAFLAAEQAGLSTVDRSTQSSEGADHVSAIQEKLVRDAGVLVTARAEELAGITGEEVAANHEERKLISTTLLTTLRDENDRVHKAARLDDITTDEYYASQDAYLKCHIANSSIQAGHDDATKEEVARLSKSYVQALAEIRDMGGDYSLDVSSAKKAVVLFDEAAQVFPADWLTQANAHTPPVAKVTKSRAHYAHLAVQETKKKQLVTARYIGTAENMPEGDSYSSYRMLDELHDGEPMYERTSYEIARIWDNNPDPDNPPRGTGWALHTVNVRRVNGDKETRTIWRRPRHRMATVDTKVAPEIRTNVSDPDAVLPGQSNGFAIAVHESTHRMEYTVNDVERLERAFFLRRTTREDGSRAPLERLGYRSKELVREGGFPHRYIGKDYGAMRNGRTKVASKYGERKVSAFEVMSVGMDSIMGGRQGALIGVGGYKADSDYRNFVLGVLATAGRTTDSRFDETRRRFGIV